MVYTTPMLRTVSTGKIILNKANINIGSVAWMVAGDIIITNNYWTNDVGNYEVLASFWTAKQFECLK